MYSLVSSIAALSLSLSAPLSIEDEVSTYTSIQAFITPYERASELSGFSATIVLWVDFTIPEMISKDSETMVLSLHFACIKSAISPPDGMLFSALILLISLTRSIIITLFFSISSSLNTLSWFGQASAMRCPVNQRFW